jgi:hypothetical protein
VTGLYDYGYRDYMPAAARFTTEDPVRDGANWFAYVNNDPVNWIDPWGLNASIGTVSVLDNEIETNYGLSSIIPGVDINLFSKTDPDEKLDEYAKDILRFDYMFVVGGHGDSGGIMNSNLENGEVGRKEAAGLAAMIKASGKYEEGKAVALYSCETGASPTGLGQELADHLGVVVFAPNDLLWYFEGEGAPVIAPKDPNPADPLKSEPDYSRQGTMNVFIPQARPGKGK